MKCIMLSRESILASKRLTLSSDVTWVWEPENYSLKALSQGSPESEVPRAQHTQGQISVGDSHSG